MTAYIAIVDGTGAFRDTTYEAEMAGSFCVQMFAALGNSVAQYERGPSMDGIRMIGRANRARDFLKAKKDADGSALLMLAGYSRGGSAAIMAAERLKRENIAVEAMFLFDPVGRHASPGGTVIPDNVRNCWVALRSQSPALLEKYESRFAKSAKAVSSNRAISVASPGSQAVAAVAAYVASDWVHPMRPGFGNAGLQHTAGKTDYRAATFFGSHGAIGGVGFADVEEDGSAQNAVAAWMNEAFKTAGLGVKVRSVPPAGRWN